MFLLFLCVGSTITISTTATVLNSYSERLTSQCCASWVFILFVYEFQINIDSGLWLFSKFIHNLFYLVWKLNLFISSIKQYAQQMGSNLMAVFEKKSQGSTTPSMILNMKNITRCGKFIPKLVPHYLVYRTYLCK